MRTGPGITKDQSRPSKNWREIYLRFWKTHQLGTDNDKSQYTFSREISLPFFIHLLSSAKEYTDHVADG